MEMNIAHVSIVLKEACSTISAEEKENIRHTVVRYRDPSLIHSHLKKKLSFE